MATTSLTPARTPYTHPDEASTRTTLVSFADHTHDVASVTVPPQPSAVAWSRVESARRSTTAARSIRARRSAGQTVSVLASEPWQAVAKASAAQTARTLCVGTSGFWSRVTAERQVLRRGIITMIIASRASPSRFLYWSHRSRGQRAARTNSKNLPPAAFSKEADLRPRGPSRGP